MSSWAHFTRVGQSKAMLWLRSRADEDAEGSVMLQMVVWSCTDSAVSYYIGADGRYCKAGRNGVRSIGSCVKQKPSPVTDCCSSMLVTLGGSFTK